MRGWVWDHAYLGMICEEIATGQHRRPPHWQVLTTAFFHHPTGLAQELTDAGLQHAVALGIQGPVWMVPDFAQSWQDAAKRESLMQIVRLVEHEPVHSPHMVAVARKPQQP